MQTSDSISEIFKALHKFQGEVSKIKKSANNPFFKSKYAPLSEIQDGTHDPLQNNGLFYIQSPSMEDTLTTRICHVSGEWIEETFPLKYVPEYLKEKDKGGNVLYRGGEYVSPQAQGSAITYAKRYHLAAMLGLNVDDDDDGNAASHRKTQSNGQSFDQKKNTPAPVKPSAKVEDLRKELENLLNDEMITEKEKKESLNLIGSYSQSKLEESIIKVNKTIDQRLAKLAASKA